MAGGAPEPEDFRTMRGQFAAIRDDIRANTATLQELAGDIRVRRMEFVEEMRAQRAALFAVIDRLEGPGPATSG